MLTAAMDLSDNKLEWKGKPSKVLLEKKMKLKTRESPFAWRTFDWKRERERNIRTTNSRRFDSKPESLVEIYDKINKLFTYKFYRKKTHRYMGYQTFILGMLVESLLKIKQNLGLPFLPRLCVRKTATTLQFQLKVLQKFLQPEFSKPK